MPAVAAAADRGSGTSHLPASPGWFVQMYPNRAELYKRVLQVRQQMHEANGGQGEVFRLAEHMAPPEPLKPKTA